MAKDGGRGMKELGWWIGKDGRIYNIDYHDGVYRGFSEGKYWLSMTSTFFDKNFTKLPWYKQLWYSFLDG